MRYKRDISPTLEICDPRSRIPIDARILRRMSSRDFREADRERFFPRAREPNPAFAISRRLKKKMLLIKYNIFHKIGYEISLFYEPRTSIPIFLSRGFTRWQFAEWKVQDLSVSLSPPFRLSFAISSTLSRSFISDVSRGLAAVAAAAARSPSEVKVRRVGTGCARIHFFGLALDFFPLFPDGEAHRISFPCMRRRPSLHGRHALHRISLSISPPLSLFLSLFRPRPRCIAR